MQVLKWAAIALYIVNGLLHIFWAKHKNTTKTFLLITVLLYYITACENLSVIIILAFLFSWAGDVLLEKSDTKFFVLGGISFMLTHLMLTVWNIMNTDFAGVSVPVTLAAAAVYLLLCGLTVYLIRDSSVNVHIGLRFLYLSLNAMMNIFMLMHMMSAFSMGSVLMYIGAVLFFVSDNFLFIEVFHRKKPDLFYIVMPTYIIGEFLIAHGITML